MTQETMEKQISRRGAEEEDKEYARDIHHRAYRDTVTGQFGSWDDAVQDEFFNKDWKPESFEVIMSDNVPAGYISIERLDNTIVLKELVVSPDFQGQGIGSKILAELIDESKSRQIPVKLVVLKNNPAHGLYIRFGFKDVGETDTHFEMVFNPVE